MRIAVLGLGRMGRWLASESARDAEVGVYDRDASCMISLAGVTKLQHPSDLAGFRPDILINAVGIGDTVSAFRSVEPFLPPDCILTDIATIKSPVFEYYGGCPFPHASIHPLFGPNFRDLGRVSGGVVILLRESAEPAKVLFRRLFESLRCRIVECSLAEHEAVMGTSLSLPVASAIAFAAALSPDPLPGSSFSVFREFARRMFQEDDLLLAEILFNPHSIRRLEDMTRSLEFLKHVIRARDYEEAFTLFERLRKKIAKPLDIPQKLSY